MLSTMLLRDEQILEVMQGVVDDFLKPKFISLGMNASGQWLNSLEARANNGVGEIWGMDYTYYLSNGRAPGKRPPIAPLVQWVGYKFGYSGQQAVSVAYAVANKIAEEGTNYYPDGTDLISFLSSQEVTDYINKKIAAHILSSFQTEMVKRAKDTLITV